MKAGPMLKAIILASTALSAMPVLAQEALIDDSGIIVTATRRDSSLQDVPYNISAVSGDTLDKIGVSSIDDLANLVPGFNYVDLGARGSLLSSTINIRGLNSEATSNYSTPLASVAPVSTYIDETPVFANLKIVDLERVEILRGPQGTLYGSGSLGGTVRFIQKKPELGKWSGRLSAGIGHTKGAGKPDHDGQAVINIPLGQTLALRASGSYERAAGYIDYPTLFALGANGVPTLANPGDVLGSAPALTSRRDANQDTTWTGRVAVYWEPSGRFNAQIAYHHQYDKSDALTATTPLSYGDKRLANANSGLSPFKSEVDLFSLDLEANLGFATLSSSTSHSNVRAGGVADVTPTYLNFSFYEGTYGATPRDFVSSSSAVSDKSFVEEIRLASNNDGPLQWVAGFFHRNQDYSGLLTDSVPGQDAYFRACASAVGFDPNDPTYDPFSGAFPPEAADCGTGSPFGVPGLATISGLAVVKDGAYVNNFRQKFKDTALFGEATFNITPAWQITGGFRAFWQTLTNDQDNGAFYTGRSLLALGLDPALAVRSVSATSKVKDVIFKANTSYDITKDHKLYATWSEGFRRGGANGLPSVIFDFGVFDVLNVNPQLFSYTPDKVTNYEVGVKGKIGRLNYGVAGFLINWDNFQINEFVTSNALGAVINGGQARSSGLEFELNGRVTDRFTMMANYAYTRSFITQYSPLLVSEVLLGVIPPNSKAQLPGTPKHSASWTGIYTVPVSDTGEVTLQLGASYSSPTNISIYPGRSRDIGNHTSVDLGLTYSADKWDVHLAVDNLFDKRNVAASEPIRTGSALADQRANFFIEPPRSVSLTFSYHFGQ